MANAQVIMICVIIFSMSVCFILIFIKMIINKKHDHPMRQSPNTPDKINRDLSILKNELNTLIGQLDSITSRNSLCQKMLATNAITVNQLTRDNDNLLQKAKHLIIDGEKMHNLASEMQMPILLNQKRIEQQQTTLLTVTEALNNLTNDIGKRHTLLDKSNDTLAILQQNLDMIKENITKINAGVTTSSHKINKLNQNEKTLSNRLSAKINASHNTIIAQ